MLMHVSFSTGKSKAKAKHVLNREIKRKNDSNSKDRKSLANPLYWNSYYLMTKVSLVLV
jgi:hypothetical protein